METTKKTLLIILCILLVVGSGMGAFYGFKKYFVKTEEIPQPTITTMASTSPEGIIPGYTQDTSMKVPDILPKNLVSEKDILFIISSFSVVQGQKTQYTFKYQSKQTLPDEAKRFITYLNNSEGWQLTNKPETTKTSSFISSRKGLDEQLFITINGSNGTVVDVTYIK